MKKFICRMLARINPHAVGAVLLLALFAGACASLVSKKGWIELVTILSLAVLASSIGAVILWGIPKLFERARCACSSSRE